jgi:ABC-type phosphate transport system permease subunit
LAGIYLAEYGAEGRLAAVTRFINDILLSAPSIVIGLFIYELSSCRWAASPAGPARWRWR